MKHYPDLVAEFAEKYAEERLEEARRWNCATDNTFDNEAREFEKFFMHHFGQALVQEVALEAYSRHRKDTIWHNKLVTDFDNWWQEFTKEKEK
jgi:hypothetical protein